jgi:hypothetical protein
MSPTTDAPTVAPDREVERDREPLEPRIRCPLCGWSPRIDTGGVCPACLQRWTETQCLSCHAPEIRLNPPIKLALAMGLPLPGYALLETSVSCLEVIRSRLEGTATECSTP